MQYAPLELLTFHAYGRLPHNEDHIDMLLQPIGLQPHDFLGHAPHPVPHDGIADLLARRNPKTEWLRQRLPRPIDDKLTVRE